MYGSSPHHLKILTFGIDFDDTITEAPLLFKKIIKLIKDEGHNVLIVTAREENGYCEQLKEFEKLVDKVIFTSQKAKADVVEVVDIWIDDFPLAITHKFQNAGFVAGDCVKNFV